MVNLLLLFGSLVLLFIGISGLFLGLLGFRRNQDGVIEHRLSTAVVYASVLVLFMLFAQWKGFFWAFFVFFMLIPGVLFGLLGVLKVMFRAL